MMPAYVIAMMNIHDPETYRKYTNKTPPTVKKTRRKIPNTGRNSNHPRRRAIHGQNGTTGIPNQETRRRMASRPRLSRSSSLQKSILHNGETTSTRRRNKHRQPRPKTLGGEGYPRKNPKAAYFLKRIPRTNQIISQ